MNNSFEFSFIYVSCFSFRHQHCGYKAAKLFEEYPDPSIIPTTAERLQYYRYKNSLMQKEVADAVGIERTTYISYENPSHKYYSMEVLEKIAELFEISVYPLLDDYNRFVYSGQGERIKALRKEQGLSQYKFAEKYGVSRNAVKRWEHERSKISVKVWKRIFGD